MSALEWDTSGYKIYETGDKKMVLYVMGSNGGYQSGVAWNGITAVSSNDSGAEETALWADDIKYAILRSAPEYGGTIEAYQAPNEFSLCDGSASPIIGVNIGQQGRRGFGISYVTSIGNDVQGTDYGYKIHLVYGCSASPSERSYQTINDSPDAMTLSWEFTTTPIIVPGRSDIKPLSHIVIDSTKMDPDVLHEIEENLYGSENNEPTLLLPQEIIDICNHNPFWRRVAADVDNENLDEYAVGDLLRSKYKSYSNPLRIVDFSTEELEDGSFISGMWLQQKYATADAVQFSHPRAIYACESELAAGTYHIICGYRVNAQFDVNEGIQFTLTEDVPAGGRLAFEQTGTDSVYVEPGLNLNVYAADGKTILETVPISKGTDGTSLGTSGSSDNINAISDATSGTFRWSTSAARQWLNSSAPAGEWWTPVDKWDVAPVSLNDIPGYLSMLPSALVAALKPVKTLTANTVSGVTTYDATYDLVTIPSAGQMYMANSPGQTTVDESEGTVFEYWEELNGTGTPYLYPTIVINSSQVSYSPTYDDLKIGSVDAPDTPCSITLRTKPNCINKDGFVFLSNASYKLAHYLPIMFLGSEASYGVLDDITLE